MRKRTRTDLLLEFLNHIVGNLLVEEFKQTALPNMKLSLDANEELSEEDFQLQLEHMKKETPAFLAWLMHPANKFPDLPPSWRTTNN